MGQFKKVASKMTSEELENLFKVSEIRRSYFFPKKIPSLESDSILEEKELDDRKKMMSNKEENDVEKN